MNKKLFDALEICLQALDRGETIDSALKRFPAQADELRPMLEAALHAKSLAGEAVAESVHRRGRAKVLQHAAQLREAKRAPRRRTWIFSMRPVVVTLLLAVFFLSGTSLVRASSTALPGDSLYTVKRSWEDITLMFASGLQRDDLELTYETERVDEIRELLAEGRHEVVSFSGYVTSQTASEWKVAGVTVLITTDTVLPAEPISVGGAVMVAGATNELGFLVAQSIVPVAPGSIVPEIESDDHEDQPGAESNRNSNESQIRPPAGEDLSNSSGREAGDDSKKPNLKLTGILQSAQGTLWVVDGKEVDISGAVIEGAPRTGGSVVVEGYYNANGVFIATSVVFGENSDGNGNGNDAGGKEKEKEREPEDEHERDHSQTQG